MKYEPVIGLEVHVQLRTESKMFCRCPNRFGAEPNTMTCPICMGHPGALPYPNREAIERIVRAGLLLGCDINRFAKFDRKSYFYPDMPKNYQITQLDLPFCLNGGVPVSGKGFSGAPLTERVIRITRIHLEEDVAKSNHLGYCSGIDFNRAGVPLMEIVSEPDMFSPDEAYAYLSELKLMMQYAGLSDCDMEKGQMRCDVNVSLRPVGTLPFGTKVELKNLNSFRAVHRALNHEIARQTAMLDNCETIIQETRGWNDDQNDSYTMRTKEDANDYRYFPDPDLPPVIFTEREIDALRETLPERPVDKRQRYLTEFGLTPYDVDTLTASYPLTRFFEQAVAGVKNPKLLANWIITELLRELSAAGGHIETCSYKPEYLAQLVSLIEQNTISGKIAKDVFAESFVSGIEPQTIVREKGLVQVVDVSAIGSLVDEVIAAFPAQVEEYRGGKAPVLQFLVGQVMKRSKGKANPPMVNDLFKSRLDS